MKKLLPQANSLSTVIDVFIYIASMTNWTLEDVAGFCKFDVRQSSYYINACFYLGLIDENSSLSDIGKEILGEPNRIKERVFERVLIDPLINKIFARLLVEGENDIKSFAIREISKEYPDYSYAVIERRTSTVLNWCLEIKKYCVK